MWMYDTICIYIYIHIYISSIYLYKNLLHTFLANITVCRPANSLCPHRDISFFKGCSVLSPFLTKYPLVCFLISKLNITKKLTCQQKTINNHQILEPSNYENNNDFFHLIHIIEWKWWYFLIPCPDRLDNDGSFERW